MTDKRSADFWLPKQAWFTVAEAAQHLAIARTACYDLIKDGELVPNQPAGSHQKFSRPRLARYIDDKHGITNDLRHALGYALGRVEGLPDQIDVVMEVLQEGT